MHKKQLLYAISGYKNSGKTRMITQLIPLLTGVGLKVAVIKHDGHEFEGDVPGTDSYRAKQSGAYGTAVFSENKILVHKDCDHAEERMLIAAFPEADIILLEGFKNSDYPKYVCDYPNKEPDSPQQIFERILELYEKME